MKYLLSIVLVALLVLPVGLPAQTSVLAHGGEMMTPGANSSPVEMMRFVEDEALENSELHEEMEALMVKMMSGTMTEAEAERMVTLMEEYPAPGGMMMNRLMHDADTGSNWGPHMNNGFGMGGWGWFGNLTMLIWLVVGILAIALLGKKLFANS